MKALFIYNPYSGKVSLKRYFWDVIQLFSSYDLTVKAIQKDESIADYVKEYAKNFDIILCSGGDGTLNSVMNGVISSSTNRPIGYIPSGSTNDFSNSLKLPKGILENAKMILEGKPHFVDAGKFNNQYFVYVAAFGLFSEVSYATNQNIKNKIGHAAYMLEGIKSLSDIKTYHLRIKTESKEFENEYIYGMISNTISVGGVYDMSKKDVKLDDGYFEMMLVEKPKGLSDLSDIVEYLLGIKTSCPLVYECKCQKVTIIPSQEMAWSLDGENGGAPEQVMFEVVPNAYQIIKK